MLIFSSFEVVVVGVELQFRTGFRIFVNLLFILIPLSLDASNRLFRRSL
jgi:hypothetical protein